MKPAKPFIFLTFFISLFSIPTYAQKSITDADFSDVVNAIEGTFPEGRITGKIISVFSKLQVSG